MYPNEDDDPATTQFTAPVMPAAARPGQRIGHRGRIAITTGVAVALIAAGTGLGLALGGSSDDHQAQNTAPSTAARSAGTGAAGAAPDRNAKPGKAEREAWAHQYGQDRKAMPDLPAINSATPEQRSAATDLLTRTEAATAPYADITAAKSAGFDLQATLAKLEQRNQKLAQRISQADSTGSTAHLPLLSVPNRANLRDTKVLDPNAPDALLYADQGHDAWKLVGAMFVANGSYPQAPPDPGGPITRWAYGEHGGGALTMHVFFVPGNDLAHAYAKTFQNT